MAPKVNSSVYDAFSHILLKHLNAILLWDERFSTIEFKMKAAELKKNIEKE